MANPFSYLKNAIKRGIGALKDDSTIFRSLRSLAQSKPKTVVDPYDKSVWVYGSIRAISTNLSRVPFKLYEKKKTESDTDIINRIEVKKGDIFKLLNEPNPFMSFRSMMEATSVYLENYGECFWLLEGRENSTQIPEEMWVHNPTRFSPRFNKETRKFEGWNFKRGNDVKDLELSFSEVIHFKYFNPYDEIRGLSPLKAATLSVDQDYYSSEYNKNFFEEGAIISGLVSVDEELGETAYKRFINQLEERHRGSGNAHKIGVLEGGAKWLNLSASQTDLDFANLKKLNKEEILSAFRTNPVVLGIYSDIKSYEGIRAAHKSFWQESLVPKIKYIEETLNRVLLSKILSGKYFGEFDLNQVEALRDDFNYKVQTAWLLHRMNFPINMINDRLNLGMSKVAWGDTVFIPNKNSTVEDILSGKAKETNNNENNNGNNIGNNDNKEDNNSNEEDDKKKPKKEEENKEYIEIFNKLNKVQNIIEKQFQSKLSRFLFEQRKAIIETLYQVSDDYKIMTSANIVDRLFPSKESDRLKTILKRLYVTSVKTGAHMIAEELEDVDFIFKEIDFEYVINSRLNVIPNDIVYTVKMHLSQTLNEGIDSGDSIDELIERIKKVYNFAGSRSKEIARIESLSAINDGRYYMIKKSGITKHKWVSYDNEHNYLNNKIIDIDSDFNDKGLKYPCSNKSDLNCSCITVPVKE